MRVMLLDVASVAGLVVFMTVLFAVTLIVCVVLLAAIAKILPARAAAPADTPPGDGEEPAPGG
jgi:uncharacterized membrane protein